MGTAQSYVAKLESGKAHPGTNTLAKVMKATGTRPRSIWSKPSLDYPRRSGMLRAATSGRLGLRKNPTSRKIRTCARTSAVWGISLGAESYSLAPEHTWGCREISSSHTRVQGTFAARAWGCWRNSSSQRRITTFARGAGGCSPRELRKRRCREQAHERERREQERMTEQLSRPHAVDPAAGDRRALWACSGQTTTARCSWRRGWLSRCGGRLGAPGSSC